VPRHYGRTCQIPQEHNIDKTLDATTLLALARPAIDGKTPVEATLPIRNTNRVVGTMTGSEVTRRHGAAGLPQDTIRFTFQGSAGQSFGAFIPRGMTLALEGDANDYLAKGLSGGIVAVRPPKGSTFVPEENVIVGNVAIYGATSGEVYIRGMAGERFGVRNSGAHAVVEGVGDHACEYMTGGRVVVLGRTGRNFAAGMSGGTAWVLDVDGTFATRCNQELVALGKLDDDAEAAEVQEMVRRHVERTGSELGKKVLERWAEYRKQFVRVMPVDYARVLKTRAKLREQGLTPEEAELKAFELNALDALRAGGN
jgi:glutamate synthase (ferredoxin)